MNAIVTDKRTLNALVRHGFILWEDGWYTRHWTGVQVPVFTVKAGPALLAPKTVIDEDGIPRQVEGNWWDVFSLNGKRYQLAYIDGCFEPFVTRVGEQRPAFV